ncbi:type I site-specific deoxyribonuclease, HsdR family [Hydrogenobacter thermophilus TK-6]|uniref:Type I restriction enzyme endonuclease subunit n=1 Tax=Hydrogenobacter thermophilus (strain DSM 6534 / IAM 12695 / TK-6) TaxID=608538 RepID=D3DF80_HYDTT|nr:type I site-specific deoxyribonuclease, HsdR family [Hydrogenobacter thermophilus TK-6]BAI68482.1 type I restriction-modification system R subunit [Hydrogenobacter thermophilus TK-6]
MYAKLDEEYYVENPFLAQLQKIGWKIYRQNKNNPEDVKEIISFDSNGEPIYGNSVKFRESFREVILEDELKKSIKRINPWIEDDQINEVVRRITTPQANSLIEANREIHDLLIENTSVSENRKTGEKSPTVRYIDFKNPDNNSFIAISQFKVNIPGTGKHIIPDIVLFVNGLPLVVVECKSPAITDPITEAITQLMRYSNRRGAKEGNEKLFWYNLFMIATSKQVAKLGTITSGYEHFNEWKDPYPYTLLDINKNGTITSQDVLIQGTLTKNNLLDILRIFTLFVEDSKGPGVIKIVPRYHQFRAVKKIVKRIKEGQTPEEKGGIVWHTQGSGKSLTMMLTVRAINKDPELSKFKIVFITDREQLEKQLRATSKSVGYTVNHADSIEKLKELLRTDTPDLVMAMIHKFQERDLSAKFPTLNESPNILVLIDEAHRTQYNILGANLRKALPNSVKIAFTGTPIEKTEQTFGDYIDKYTIKQAVEDGVTVEIVYEGRAHLAEISDEEAANAKFESVFYAFDNEEKQLILGKYTWKSYLENENVIKEKAKDIIEHYITHIFPNGFKAQVIAVSRLAAVRYKEKLEEALKEKIAELEKNNPNNIDIDTLKRLKVAVIISGTPNDDPQIYKKEYTDVNEHDKNIKSFKMPFNKSDEKIGINGDVGIIVVNEMLVTGFDAPIEQALYLDNVLKGHRLLQAIARVNRVYKNKYCGYVVDYVGVFNHLKEALAVYSDSDIEEISQTVVNKSKIKDELKYIHNQIEDFFKKFKISNWRENIDECIDLLEDEEIREEFITLVRKFNSTLDKLLPDPEALKYTKDLKVINFIKEAARQRYRDDKLSIKDVSNKIREIVEQYLVSKGIDPKIPPIPLLSDEFTIKLKQKPPKAKAVELEYAIKEHIEKHFEEDPELYERFSDKLKKILEEYKENWDLLAEKLENLRIEIKKGREEENTYELDPKKEMPFLGLLKDMILGKEPLEKYSPDQVEFLVKLTKDILKIIKGKIKIVDFWENYTKQKELIGEIISHLLKQGRDNNIFNKRNEIAQRLLELAYHIYGGKTDGN